MDRLENMKRNATQTGCGLSSNRCSLCGDYFCLLRTAPTQCNSCNMILCNKCCIDTECTIDNDLSNNSLQSRRNSSSNLSMTNSFIGQTSGNSKTVYLCRICSEQREVYLCLIVYLNLDFFLVFKKIRSMVSEKVSKLFNKWNKYKIKVNFYIECQSNWKDKYQSEWSKTQLIFLSFSIKKKHFRFIDKLNIFSLLELQRYFNFIRLLLKYQLFTD